MTTDTLLITIACGLYVVATALAAAHARTPTPARGRGIMIAVAMGAVCLGLSLMLRGLRLGRFPAFGALEAASWYALAVALAYLYVAWRHDVLRVVSTVVLPFTGAILVVGLLSGLSPTDHPVPVPGNLLGIHVTAAFAGYGLFALQALLAAGYLIQDRNLKRKHFGPLSRSLPSLEILDRAMGELNGPGLALFTLSIGLGIALAHVNKWGIQWAYDPKVMVTGATWGVYALLYYLYRGAHQHGRHVAYVAMIGFVGVMLAFFGVHLVADSLHNFGFQIL